MDQNATFAEYVSLGIPRDSLDSSHDSFLGLHCLTGRPEPSRESCSFYMSEIRRESLDMEAGASFLRTF